MKKREILKQNISNHLMMNGNKRTSEKVLLKTLKSLQKSQSKKNFESLVKTSLINSSPLLYVKQIKRKRKRTFEFPFLLSLRLKISYAAKFLILNSRKKKVKSFYKNFHTELINSSRKESLSVKQKTDLHEDGFKIRKFARYRWFK